MMICKPDASQLLEEEKIEILNIIDMILRVH